MTPLQSPLSVSGSSALQPGGGRPSELQAPAPEPCEPTEAPDATPRGGNDDGSTSPASAHDERLVCESGGGVSRPRRRARRRELRCPRHPEQKIFSVSPKHHVYVTDVGQLMLRGLGKRRADELLAAYRRVLPLTNEWIECFWCDDCACTSWWHVQRHDRHDYILNKVPRELWEQATGVIRVEGNPTVSHFSRRQARASGVHGMRQYRFL